MNESDVKIADAYRVRRAAPADVDGMLAVERASFSEPWSEILLRDCFNDTTDVLVLVAEGVIGGFCIVDRALGDEAELQNIALLPSLRGQGLSHLLLKAALKEAKARGVTRVMLEVRVSNAAARALYRHWGFETVGRRPRYYRHPTEDAVLMDVHL